MEGGKPYKEMMIVHASGELNVVGLEEGKGRKDWALKVRKEKGKKDLAMSWA